MKSHTDKVKIMVPIGCRSDGVLSTPIISRLEAVEEFEVHKVQLHAPDFYKSYGIMDTSIVTEDPDFVLLVGDRIEMCAAAAACFHRNVKTGQVYAGVLNSLTTLDDLNRHAITIWSDIQFCEDINAVHVVRQLKASVGLPSIAYDVGITHFDDIDIDSIHASKMNGDYDVVLYNPVTRGNVTKEMMSDVESIIKVVKNGVHLISSNPDPGNGIAVATISDMLQENGIEVALITSIPHDRFLSLLKGCKQFITNSSSAAYEAPVLLEPEQIVQVGNRNWARSRGPFETGASDRIVSILKTRLLLEK